jgi:hypothetical protein
VISRQELEKISEHLAGDLGRLSKNLPKTRGEKVILLGDKGLIKACK